MEFLSIWDQCAIQTIYKTQLFLQDLLLGDHCCIDIMGATQFHTPRANWDKRCCSNPNGPVVPIPEDLSQPDAKMIDKQIERMPTLKEVRFGLEESRIYSGLQLS